jgi:hypothetical protein
MFIGSFPVHDEPAIKVRVSGFMGTSALGAAALLLDAVAFDDAPLEPFLDLESSLAFVKTIKLSSPPLCDCETALFVGFREDEPPPPPLLEGPRLP